MLCDSCLFFNGSSCDIDDSFFCDDLGLCPHYCEVFMQYYIYSVRDVLNGFSVPVCDFNDKSAIRNFRSSLSAVSDVVRRDYDLFRVGIFDVESGVIIPETNPVLVFRGVECEVVRDE